MEAIKDACGVICYLLLVIRDLSFAEEMMNIRLVRTGSNEVKIRHPLMI